MELTYEVIDSSQAELCRDLCNELMTFQKSKAHIKPELFDSMNFETRMLPSVKGAIRNYIVLVKDGDKPVAYVYANIASKEAYDNDFATFFDLSSVQQENVGCLSQFYIKEGYRQHGIGSKLFDMSMNWLNQIFINEKDFLSVTTF
jgi:GNAT superfamily N-acetyltransferase